MNGFTSRLHKLAEEANAPVTNIDFQGLSIAIEHPKGSVREGVDDQGQPWQQDMEAHYGYIENTMGAGDGEALDVYVGPDEDSTEAYVVEQLKEDGSFDEYKILLGVPDAEQALHLYEAHYPKAWVYTRVGDVWSVPMEKFKAAVEGEQAAQEQRGLEAADTQGKVAAEAEEKPKQQRAKPGQFPKPAGYRPLLTTESTKTSKGEKLGYLTGILYLAPAEEAGGKNICPASSPGCRRDCLFTAGRGKFDAIRDARIRKTQFYFSDPEAFLASLRFDISKLERDAAKEGLTPVVRVNGTSDLPKLAQQMAREFPHILHYDYTKIPGAHRRTLPNYDITFSLSEENEHHAKTALSEGLNLAVVFNVRPGQPLPDEYMGHKVIDGDEHDLRFLDGKAPDGRPVIVGLRAKGDAKKQSEENGFVIRVEDLGKGGIAVTDNNKNLAA